MDGLQRRVGSGEETRFWVDCRLEKLVEHLEP